MKTRRLSPREVLPLRLEVLRPGMPPESAQFVGDHLATTSHWGALDPEGQIVAVATLMQTPMPGRPAGDPSLAAGLRSGEPAWQVRGMASAPQVRGQGYGAAVLLAAIDFARSQGGASLIWCNARLVAVPFYVAQGFQTVGPEFEIVGIGPHFLMWMGL